MASSRPLTTAREMHKLVSYNLLSPSLAAPSYFIHCKPQNMDPTLRLQRILEKLQPHVQEQAIICMQEVSASWAGPLHAYFATSNYHMVTGLYGDKFSGYMGVALAVPLSKYELLDASISRVADTKTLVPREKPAQGPALVLALGRVLAACRRSLTAVLTLVRLVAPALADPWKLAAARFNQMLCVRLRSKASGSTFAAATYHMPCMFRQPQVMMLHCALSAQHIQAYAGNDPFLFAGDFNIKPGSPMYRLLTEGHVEQGDPEHPPPPPSQPGGAAARKGDPAPMAWPLSVAPMRSAYSAALGREPDFTNHARTVRDAEPFLDTLDYIFVSPHWQVADVGQLPDKRQAAAAGPQPTDDEPSDHLLISAKLSL